MIADSKRCRSCNVVKDAQMFYKRKSNSDGLYSYCKECTDRKGREWRDSTPWWKEHKKNYDRERVERLRPSLSMQMKERYKEKRDSIIAYASEWSKNNRDKRRAISQSYKHRRRSIEADGVGGGELAKWRSQQDNVCFWCMSADAEQYTIDHFYPLSKGGRHELDNLVIACRRCNLIKNAKDPMDFAREIGRLDLLEKQDG